MKKEIFTADFYSKLTDTLIKDVNSNDVYYEDLCEGKSISMDCYIDDMYVTCDVCFSTEVHDDSFDHAFGTWHDPYPYLEADGITDIDEVHVYESDENDSPEIEGFSYDDFWAPYEKDSYILRNGRGRVKAGDKVIYDSKEVEFLSYNTMKEVCKVRYEDGSIHYTLPRYLRPRENTSAA